VGDLFLVEGPAMRDRLTDIGCPPKKLQILHLGIDVGAVRFEARDFSQPLKVLMMARFVEKKGLVDGLEACAAARRRGLDLTVRIVGDAGNDDSAGQLIKKQLLDLAAGPELTGRVEFCGFVKPEDTKTIMRDCHVFLCPSKHGKNRDGEGGSPLSLTEAMAAGLLCIGTRHCDIPEVVKDSKTGYLCASSDVAALSEALVRIAEEPSESLALTRCGREHIEQEFSIAKQVQELAEIYALSTAKM
jgi:colanic acid/amylovoran biosynthesis glycosyltransferase